MNEQEKWEKVIADLQEARRILGKVDEPTFWLDYVINAVDDALALLKAQEPVEPRVGKDGWYRCGGCNNPLASGDRVTHFYGHPWPKHCEGCGRAVKWDG